MTCSVENKGHQSSNGKDHRLHKKLNPYNAAYTLRGRLDQKMPYTL